MAESRRPGTHMGSMIWRFIGRASRRAITVAILVPMVGHHARRTGVLGVHGGNLSAMKLKHWQLGVFHDRDEG